MREHWIVAILIAIIITITVASMALLGDEPAPVSPGRALDDTLGELRDELLDQRVRLQDIGDELQSLGVQIDALFDLIEALERQPPTEPDPEPDPEPEPDPFDPTDPSWIEGFKDEGHEWDPTLIVEAGGDLTLGEAVAQLRDTGGLIRISGAHTLTEPLTIRNENDAQALVIATGTPFVGELPRQRADITLLEGGRIVIEGMNVGLHDLHIQKPSHQIYRIGFSLADAAALPIAVSVENADRVLMTNLLLNHALLRIDDSTRVALCKSVVHGPWTSGDQRPYGVGAFASAGVLIEGSVFDSIGRAIAHEHHNATRNLSGIGRNAAVLWADVSEGVIFRRNITGREWGMRYFIGEDGGDPFGDFQASGNFHADEQDLGGETIGAFMLWARSFRDGYRIDDLLPLDPDPPTTDGDDEQ